MKPGKKFSQWISISAIVFAIAFQFGASNLWAQNVGGVDGIDGVVDIEPDVIDDSALQCHIGNTGIFLEWNIQFFAPIKGFEIYRNNELIASLEPSATQYMDREVGPGVHVYELVAVPLPILPPNPIEPFGVNIIDIVQPPRAVVGRCKIEYDRDPAVRCSAEENKVKLEWGPILIRVAFDKFRIYRNGVPIATVPSDQLSYEDEVFSVGVHTYQVNIVALGGHEIEVGKCRVEVDCFGLRVRISNLNVHLDWRHLPLPEIASRFFTVIRDGELLGKTQELTFHDPVDEPGEYVYQVFMDLGTGGAPVRIIGSCIVNVVGNPEPPQPVENLTCAVAIPAIDPGQDPNQNPDRIIGFPFVSLNWENPQDYDRIIISRNKAIVARLDGDATHYNDRPLSGGLYIYSVIGVVGNQSSEPEQCEVEVPPVIIPPPQELQCEYVRLRLNSNDPAAVDFAPEEIDRGLDAVVLKWWNPILYGAIIITRNGERIAAISGRSMIYRDFNPPKGEHVYGVIGVMPNDRASVPAECKVVVSNEPVPPIKNLRCVVSRAEADPTHFSVILVWENGGEYDQILLFRNNELIEEIEGDAQKWRDFPPEPGVYTYTLVGVKDGERSERRRCQVVIEGPPDRNLLYFSNSPSPILDPNVPDSAIPFPSRTLTCLVDNVDRVQGWSFGLSGDPEYVQVEEATIVDTATEKFNEGNGPDFLFLQRSDTGGGVVMAAVISTMEPFETLPPDHGHSLLKVSFEPGSKGSTGQSYQIRYTETIGTPPVEIFLVINGIEQKTATLPGFVFFPGPRFLRGDANGDGVVDMSDALFTLKYLFLGGEEPGCMEAANINGTDGVNIADPIFELTWQFLGGVEIPFPFPHCAVARAPLGCKEPGICIDILPADS